MTKTTTSLSLAVALLFVACNGGQDAEITAPSAIEAVLPSAKPSGMPASVATLTLTGTVSSVEDGLVTVDVTGTNSLGKHITAVATFVIGGAA